MKITTFFNKKGKLDVLGRQRIIQILCEKSDAEMKQSTEENSFYRGIVTGSNIVGNKSS